MIDAPCNAPTDPPRLARISGFAPITIVVPTYREAANLPAVIERVEGLRDACGLEAELLFMDDDSRDGSDAIVRDSGRPWARLVTRTRDRGLSPSVIEGLRLARHDVVVCMDADLSHPPEKIPDMLLALASGQHFVIGSRYVRGGSTDEDWGLFRYLNSRIATLLARPLTDARDPMSGFFAMRKSDFDRANDLNPIGYKIALELIVKCGIDNVGEVPIHFADRVRGQSKLTAAEQLRYVQHLWRLYVYRFGRAMGFVRFLMVGAAGLIVNLAVVTLTTLNGAGGALAVACGAIVSLIGNLALHARFTFHNASGRQAWRPLAGFVVAAIVAIALNLTVAIAVLNGPLAGVRLGPQWAAVAGVAAGAILNFAGNRFVAFKRRYAARGRH